MASPDKGQHYNLKWTNHTTNILQTFVEHFHKESLVDVTLSCEGRFIKAHKIILSACSNYFAELFNVHTVQNPLIIMNGVKFSTLQQMIDFMYEGETKVADDDFDVLIKVAEDLEVKGLCRVRSNETRTNQNTAEATGEKCTLTTPLSIPSTSASVETQSKESSNSESSVRRKRRKQSYSPIRNQPSDGTLLETANTETISKLVRVSAQELEDRTAIKIPRPPNAFMLYANEWRKKIAAKFPGESNKEVSVRLGATWKSLPSAIKDQYYAAAKKVDEEHKIKYPGPKEARIRKELRSIYSQRNNSATNNISMAVRQVDSSNLVTLVLQDNIMDGTEEEDEEINCDGTNEVKEEVESMSDSDSTGTSSNGSGKTSTNFESTIFDEANKS